MKLNEYLVEHIKAVEQVSKLEESLQAVANMMHKTLESGGTIYFCGNGGSAADAQHLAAELVGTFYNKERKALKAIALTTDSSCLTSIANDFDYDEVFVRQIEAHCGKQDLVFMISTSGNSLNLIKAAQVCSRSETTMIGLLGNGGGTLGELVDFEVIVDSDRTSIIQECHILIGHYLCYKLEENYVS